MQAELKLGRTDVQWSQIRLSGSEPCVTGSSWGCFQSDCHSNCTVMEHCVQCDQKSQLALHHRSKDID